MNVPKAVLNPELDEKVRSFLLRCCSEGGIITKVNVNDKAEIEAARLDDRLCIDSDNLILVDENNCAAVWAPPAKK